MWGLPNIDIQALVVAVIAGVVVDRGFDYLVNHVFGAKGEEPEEEQERRGIFDWLTVVVLFIPIYVLTSGRVDNLFLGLIVGVLIGICTQVSFYLLLAVFYPVQAYRKLERQQELQTKVAQTYIQPLVLIEVLVVIVTVLAGGLTGVMLHLYGALVGLLWSMLAQAHEVTDSIVETISDSQQEESPES